jgi:hypothetical protein
MPKDREKAEKSFLFAGLLSSCFRVFRVWKSSGLWSDFTEKTVISKSHKLWRDAKGKILRFLYFLHKNLRILVGVAGFSRGLKNSPPDCFSRQLPPPCSNPAPQIRYQIERGRQDASSFSL